MGETTFTLYQGLSVVQERAQETHASNLLCKTDVASCAVAKAFQARRMAVTSTGSAPRRQLKIAETIACTLAAGEKPLKVI